MLDKADFISKITERLQPFEKERIIRLSKLAIREFFVVSILIFLIAGFILTIEDTPLFDGSAGLVGLIAGLAYYSYYDITHTNKLFKNFIKEKCSNIIKKYISFNGSTITSGILKRSNLFGYFEDVNVDDGFCGTYNSVDYKILETSLTAKSAKGYDIQIYKGLIVLFDFNKKILEDTIIARKGDDCIKQNLHGLNIKRIMIPFSLIIAFIIIAVALTPCPNSNIWDSLKLVCMMVLPGFIFVSAIIVIPFGIAHIMQQRKNKMADTEMEDIVFNKDYIVHTKDKVEARYLITTAFIERYLKLQKIFKTKNIKCSFLDEQLIIAIPARKDFFEVGSIFLPLSSTTHINKFYDDIEEILKVIDVLKLNERTGL